MRLRREQFEALVAQAVRSLPFRFRRRLDNVVVMVRDLPSRETADKLGRTERNILGLYQGVPQRQRGVFYSNVPPDRIVLFQQNIEAAVKDTEELVRCVEDVVRHEIGHHFGLKDGDMSAEEGSDDQ